MKNKGNACPMKQQNVALVALNGEAFIEIQTMPNLK